MLTRERLVSIKKVVMLWEKRICYNCLWEQEHVFAHSNLYTELECSINHLYTSVHEHDLWRKEKEAAG